MWLLLLWEVNVYVSTDFSCWWLMKGNYHLSFRKYSLVIIQFYRNLSCFMHYWIKSWCQFWLHNGTDSLYNGKFQLYVCILYLISLSSTEKLCHICFPQSLNNRVLLITFSHSFGQYMSCMQFNFVVLFFFFYSNRFGGSKLNINWTDARNMLY
jgi:hypothetical protein